MQRLILGTAGHIDHGKTTLVRALTGTDTDRLAEEKRRGITIDLGFARLALPGGAELGIVDVPGHEAFVRNMLAGATGIDIVMLVVAADEGVMPQTREHLAIVELLGVRGGVVALTKTDLVEPEWLDLVLDDLRSELQRTAFAGTPIVPVSARTGEGLDDLLAALADAAGVVQLRAVTDLFRMPIDRVFTIRGTGTVVTGTVWAGSLQRDAPARILPLGATARVRTLQAHGDELDHVHAGQRAAVALVGADRDALRRGDVLVSDSAWEPSHMLTARLRVLSDTGWSVRPRQRIRFHLGTAEVLGRVAALEGAEIGPGEAAWVQLRLESPVVARAGDPFVIRSYSPVTTIGGGHVAEPVPPKRKRVDEPVRPLLDAILAGSPAESIAARVRLAGWLGAPRSRLPVETPHPPDRIEHSLRTLEDDHGVLVAADLVFDPGIAGRARDALLRAADAFHAAHPLRIGTDRDELRRAVPAAAPPALAEWALSSLLVQGQLQARAGLVARTGWQPDLTAEQRLARDELLDRIRAAGLAPPALGELPASLGQRDDLADLVKLLEHDGEIVALGPELYVARDVVEEAVAGARRRLADRDTLSAADFKAVFAVSRKFLIPLLEYLDRTGVTRRRGDERVWHHG